MSLSPQQRSFVYSITWLKDDNVLVISKRISVKQGRINITSATERDEGTYFCEANNTYGVSRSLGKYLTKSSKTLFHSNVRMWLIYCVNFHTRNWQYLFIRLQFYAYSRRFSTTTAICMVEGNWPERKENQDYWLNTCQELKTNISLRHGVS